MISLSVNINKFATLRNARGGHLPNLIKVAEDCQYFGADGITIHPRPDERHITTKDVIDLKSSIKTEYNIEGYPNDRFFSLLKQVKPEQATLVPDAPNVITSNAGWDTIKHEKELKSLVKRAKQFCDRVSIFVNPNPEQIRLVKGIGADRIELYTGPYATHFTKDPTQAIQPYIICANLATSLGLQINAGHDLNQKNLRFFAEKITNLAEVSIGHALVCDALYLGLENTINIYKRTLEKEQ